MEDIDTCEKIFGPNINKLKGNILRTKLKAVVNDCIDISQGLKDTHQNIELFANTMYIQGQTFLLTISNKIRFIVIQDITDISIPILNQAFDKTFRV